ncbi:hypothetical protein IW261DRAFT_119665 [Armillaria novae-zelandiae]|uniref:Uncharacterized protein n=1 Tax=Armillaria novae-zelandiae TaxID=153914 RepID=A0AA39PAS5_9AGAR|nr:hypothetical protein IW261DRAFT_119665 [Armillaria novae-zelandiae]
MSTLLPPKIPFAEVLPSSASLPERSTRSRTSSLRGISLKAHRTFILPVASFLGRRGRGPENGESRHSPAFNTRQNGSAACEKVSGEIDSPVIASLSEKFPVRRSTGAERHTTNSPTPQLQTSKSKTLLRTISTTFRKVSPTIPSSPSPPVSQYNRDAALRARGLLPPLPLSIQELEQDRRIPSLELKDDTDDDQPSAAHRIKEEWETKNRTAEAEQRERLTHFKFGGLSSQSASDLTQPQVLEVVIEMDSPAPSPTTAAPLHGKSLKPPALHLHPSTSCVPSHDVPSGPEPDPVFVPLPPSPLLTSVAEAVDVDPALIPIPPSPISKDLVLPAGHATSSSIPADKVGSQKQLYPPSPTFLNSVTPPSSPTMSTGHSTEEGSLAPPSRKRSHTVLSHESSDESSIATPSIDATSQVLTIVTTSSESHASKRRSGGKAWATDFPSHDIPVIVESPKEESTSPFSNNGNPFDAPVGPESSTLRRGLTDPSTTESRAKGQRRRSLNLFKKLDKAPGSRSLTTIRRSVVGTLGRKEKSTLPPSPTIPSPLPSPPPPPVERRGLRAVRSLGFNRQLTVVTGAPLPPPKPRQPLSPTIHNPGSILLGTCEIEDEESRRVTELAFLG